MNPHASVRGLAILTAGVLILACSLVRPPGARSTASPSDTLSTGPGIPVIATPIRLVIPEGLAAGANADMIDVVTEQTGAPWDVAPAHLQLTLQAYPVQNSFHVPQIFAYPAAQYTSMNATAAESLKRLTAVLANPNGRYDNDTLPHVPFFNAGQVFAAQQRIIHFSSGSGIRTVTQYAQDVSPINNGGLFYHFEGLTSDGKYYIVAVLPVNLPFLPSDNNPDTKVPPGGVPFPAGSSPGSSFEGYFKRVSGMIDAAGSGQFEPTLNSLDALIQSISAQ